MENLTKQQIILVTLLVSFVTSIATGIVTVSLMEQAPSGVVQTINHVVEHTVERVVPQESQGAVVRETIVVTTEDQAEKAIEQNIPSVVKIKAKRSGESDAVFTGLGVIISKTGLVLSDHNITSAGSHYSAIHYDGGEYPLELIQTKHGEASFFKIIVPEEKKKSIVFAPAVLADSDKVKLGQSVIALTGRETLSVSLGFIQSIDRATNLEYELTTTTDSKRKTAVEKNQYLGTISTNIADDILYSGSPLLNLDGEIIGIKTVGIQDDAIGDFTPINSLKAFIPNIQ